MHRGGWCEEVFGEGEVSETGLRYRKPVFVVTGIKVARGARARSMRIKGLAVETAVEADAAVWGGVPIAGGPGVGGVKETRREVGWEGRSDFVFAFRVKKVMAEKRTGGVKSEHDYRAGAMLDSGAGDVTDNPILRVMEVGEADGGQDEFSVEVLMEGDEEIVCAVPCVDEVDEEE
jgi:hypothetical protein